MCIHDRNVHTRSKIHACWIWRLAQSDWKNTRNTRLLPMHASTHEDARFLHAHALFTPVARCTCAFMVWCWRVNFINIHLLDLVVRGSVADKKRSAKARSRHSHRRHNKLLRLRNACNMLGHGKTYDLRGGSVVRAAISPLMRLIAIGVGEPCLHTHIHGHTQKLSAHAFQAWMLENLCIIIQEHSNHAGSQKYLYAAWLKKDAPRCRCVQVYTFFFEDATILCIALRSAEIREAQENNRKTIGAEKKTMLRFQKHERPTHALGIRQSMKQRHWTYAQSAYLHFLKSICRRYRTWSCRIQQ
jgi:hypothetical protein